MARIFYSMSGEGRGHAARAAAIVDQIQHRHELILLAPGQAYEFLAPRYRSNDSVQVRRIPGLRFHYVNQKLALGRSLAQGLRFWAGLGDAVQQIAGMLRRHRPDLLITDFEPLLPRAAKQAGVNYISLDHQHFLSTFDLSPLPVDLRCWAMLMDVAVKAHYRDQAQTIVTSFFDRPINSARQASTISVGPIVRAEVADANPSWGNYVVSYLRPHTPSHVLTGLQSAGVPVRVYGLGARPATGNLQFRDFDKQRFVDDLAGSLAVIGAAGNQTLGEALYMGKPVLALPENRHFEQRINAFFLQHQGYGLASKLTDFDAATVREFMARRTDFLPAIENVRRDGLEVAVQAVLSHLPRTPVRAVAPAMVA